MALFCSTFAQLLINSIVSVYGHLVWLPMASEGDKVPAKDGDVMVPGDHLCQATVCTPGSGTYTRHKGVFSTLAGRVKIDRAHHPLPLISVEGKKMFKGVPTIGSIVVAKVINISERQAKVSILSVNNTLLEEPLHGVILKENVRAMEKDTVEIFSSFRPGDMVRARVVSLGESQAYSLSTAENELGVMVATSDGGEAMVPISWCVMQCTKTGVKERRKVAKVINTVAIQ